MATSKKQQLSLLGAVAIGVASMLGAGVFFVWSAAYESAGNGFFFAGVLAATVASLNAASVYQLAKGISRAGGIYAYSRVYLPKSISFTAGFSFVFGKIASIAAIALIIQIYVVPQGTVLNPIAPSILNELHVASLAVILMTCLNLLGINRTALVAAILATITLGFLVFSVVVGLNTGFDSQVFTQFALQPSFSQGTLAGAAIIFFAFAGYARVATLGDEVRDPKRNIPRAIVISLGIVIVLYFFLSLVVSGVIGSGNEPMRDATFEALLAKSAPWFNPAIIDGVVLAASLGSILALLAGVSRTAATMAEDRELPKIFEKRNRFGAPWLAELLIAIGAIVLIETKQYTAWVIGFSSFSVLLYYAIGHLSVLRQPKTERKQPLFVAIAGLALCLLLLANVPGPAVPISLAILAVALGFRFILQKLFKAN
ncbi:MAG: APC family permease [Microbacteriaceae bacterium]|nr:APC family permease [Microbacteriaceae bacterium]